LDIANLFDQNIWDCNSANNGVIIRHHEISRLRKWSARQSRLIAMNESGTSGSRRWSGLSDHVRGHFLLFDKESPQRFDATTGGRLLLSAAGIEVVRLIALRWTYAVVPLVIFVSILLACALLLVRFAAGLELSRIGLYPWQGWQPVEKSYFVQLLVIANVVFPFILAGRLRLALTQSSLGSVVANVFVPYLIFGFYQEVVYRGMLQSELVRRWKVTIGILIANILYTFGPLHWRYFSTRASLAIPMFAAIFAIGLFFGLLFRRSGNLWIVAVTHGIGNAYTVTGLSQ
jgi:membrane protease YdiL (CAAX protease family)